MSHSHDPSHPADEVLRLGDGAKRLATMFLLAGLAAGVLALLISLFWGGFSYFMHAYLVGFMFTLAICLGGLFFVLVTHVFRAGWSVNIRRIFECLAATLPVLGLLAVPIVVLSLFGYNGLYVWATYDAPVHAEEGDHHEGEAHEDDVHGGDGDATPVIEEADAPGRVHGTEAIEPVETGGAEHDADAHGHVQADSGISDDLATDSGHTVNKPLAGEVHYTDEQMIHAVRDAAGNPYVSRWGEIAYTSHEDHKVYDELAYQKRGYLNPIFFAVRVILYFVILSAIGLFYWRRTTRQDETRDPHATYGMEKFAPPLLVPFAVVLTLVSFDFIMSLDPHWFSTIFGVYYFAGAFESALCVGVITLNVLQRNGYLVRSVRTEHYHDLGKLMFAFVFFWGYIAFSQYMLLWYANIPETTTWLSRRGLTTFSPLQSGWTAVGVALLFGHLLIPFAGLLSRHIKRSKGLLTFWAVWMLIFCWVDLWWLISPEMRVGVLVDGDMFKPAVRFPVVEVLATVAIVGVVGYAFISRLASASLRPLGDARVNESTTYAMKY